MKISGFTMVRNAEKLYFPIIESILSILPMVDEYIIAIDEGDPDDSTLKMIQDIHSEKIKIFSRQWSEESFKESRILAEETNYALSKCSGDWCFYLQADEVIHEKDMGLIKAGCKKYLDDEGVDGLLFDYYHFWGDYDHFLPFHGWYKKEIRIIRNRKGITSIKDAQSFRMADGNKLTVRPLKAHVYHYGWVRPPSLMQNKKKIHDGLHRGTEKAEKEYLERDNHYDYGPLGRVPTFDGSHPAVMSDRIKKIDWKDQLNYGTQWVPSRPLNKHEKWKYRMLTWIENTLLGGREIGGYKNWKIK
jgi:glycosyltransferase involved in cell wall biosynthesis